jgi:comEA protein
MLRFSPVLLLSLFACNNDGLDDNDNIDLTWNEAEVFYVGAAYRETSNKGVNNPVDLEAAVTPEFDDNWSDEAFWTYQVVETGLVPTQDDPLYEYAVFDGEVQSLSVLRAYVDASLNTDSALIENDPVVYMVFREDRDRLAAIISFSNNDGERVEQAWSTNALDASFGTLSQSMLTDAPTYLAPFTTSFENDSITLENGSELFTEVVADGVVDASFEDELGGDIVTTRYEVGQPWPTLTISSNLQSRLLTEDDLAARRSELPPLLDEPPENFDYRTALRATVNIDSSLTLDQVTIDSGWDSQAFEGYRPWAGSWWALSKAELVFGYDDLRETYSGLIFDDVKPIKEDMDRLSEALRDMDSSSSDYETKRTEYSDKQSELVTILREFYDGLRQDLDGGIISIEDGVMTHSTDEWSFEVNELSPFDKFALHRHLAGDSSPNPFYAPASEILNGYNPVGGTWWGHCNGWAAAAILNDEPRESITRSVGDVEIEYTTADLKGLLSETHYSTRSSFYGARYNGEEDDISDLTPKAYHHIIQFYLREQQVPLVFDTTASEAVWNFPAWGANVDVTETTPAGEADKVNMNTATKEELDTLPGIGPVLAEAIIEYRMYKRPFQAIDELTEVSGIGDGKLGDMRDLITVSAFERSFGIVATVQFTTDGVDETYVDADINNPQGFTERYQYTLTTDAKGRVTGGAWQDDSEHPDFAWVPYYNAKTEGQGSSENAYVPYGSFLSLVTDELERR